MTAWKDLERRICTALGGRRAGPIGAAVSDCVNTPFAVEIKRSSRPGPPVLTAWITQARDQGRREARPWLVVVAGHNDRSPIVALDFKVFCELCEQAGIIPANNREAPMRSETPEPTEPTPTPVPEPDQPDDE
jgi:hypothetical protein